MAINLNNVQAQHLRSKFDLKHLNIASSKFAIHSFFLPLILYCTCFPYLMLAIFTALVLNLVRHTGHSRCKNSLASQLVEHIVWKKCKHSPTATLNVPKHSILMLHVSLATCPCNRKDDSAGEWCSKFRSRLSRGSIP